MTDEGLDVACKQWTTVASGAQKSLQAAEYS